jgi:hypothetical protein
MAPVKKANGLRESITVIEFTESYRVKNIVANGKMMSTIAKASGPIQTAQPILEILDKINAINYAF